MVWAAGQRLQKGKYIIEKILGEGGFGITYQARHTLLQQLMVIKTPNERLKNDPEYPKYLQRFVEEGRRLEKLSEKQHPNIVRVRDLFEESGIYCLVMDFVAGESLFDLVRQRGALPGNEAVEYVRQIGEALTVIHQAQLVHRDAHPGNIMVQRDGRAVLIDFGIAGEILQTIESSKHFGNLAFAPYEQMMGSREPTVDVYCLAASLYYAVTGQCPTSSLDRKLKNVGLIKPKQHVDITEELNRAILKGMELEAKNRPQSMQEWMKLLGVQYRTVPVSLPPKKQRTVPWDSLKTNIPWLYLTGVFSSYGVLGFLSAPSAFAVAVVVAFAGAETYMNMALIEADFETDPWFRLVLCFLIAVVGWAVAGAFVGLVAEAVVWARVVAGAGAGAGLLIGLLALMLERQPLKNVVFAGVFVVTVAVTVVVTFVIAFVVAVAVAVAGSLAGAIAGAVPGAALMLLVCFNADDNEAIVECVAGSFAIAVAGCYAGAIAVAGVGPFAVAVAVAGAVVGAVAGAVAVAVTGPWIKVGIRASYKLLNSFSKFHTFLILLGTSWLGLGLGWFAYQVFPIFR